MKVLIVTQYFPPEVGAAQTRLGALARHLAERGDDVEVITAMPNYPTGRIFDGYRGRLLSSSIEGGVRLRRVWVYAAVGTGVMRLMNYLSFSVTCVLGLLGAPRPDVLFIESPPLFVTLPTMLFARIRRVRLTVLNVADLWPDAAVDVGALEPGRLLDVAHALERWAYRRAGLISTVTPVLRDELIATKDIPSEKVVLLENGADTGLFGPDAGDPSLSEELELPPGPFLIYAGTMGLAHGIDPLIDAMAGLRSEAGSPFLLMIGAGSDRSRLEGRVRELGLENVLFRDAIPIERLARLLPLAEAGIVTLADIHISEHTRPAKLFPLMAAGLPVIHAGAGQGATDLVAAGGGLAIANRAEAIAAAIRQLHADPDLRRRLGANGRTAVVERWSWDAQIGVWYEAVMQRLASSR